MSDAPVKNIATATADIAETRYTCSIRTGEHSLLADEPAPEGGDAGPSPFGLVLSGLGACTAITLRMYAERKGWPLERVHVRLAYQWRDHTPHIDREVSLEGALDADQRATLAEICEKTPVTRALKSGIVIDTRFAP
jgi:putative redox protein